MRKFYLIDGDGIRYGLNGEDGIWLDSPTGLGVSYAPNFADFGNGFFVDVFNKTKQGSIVCNLLFEPPGAYGRYQSFMRTVTKSESLTLIYDPDGTAEYSRIVELEQISKSELTGSGELLCATTFICLTPWFRTENISGSAVIYARGDLMSAFVISASVTGSNPSFTLTDTNSQILGSADISGSYSGAAMVLSTIPYDSYITSNGNDICSNLSVVNNPFFRLPSQMSARISNSVNASMSIEVFHYWRTV